MKRINFYSLQGALCALMLLITTITFAQQHNVGNGIHGISGSPTASVYQDNIYVLFQGYGDNQHLEYRVKKDGEWSLQSRVEGIDLLNSPGSVVYNNHLYVFHQDANGEGQLKYTTFDGSRWSPDTDVANAALSEAPFPLVYHDKLYVFYQGKDHNGHLEYSVYDGDTWTVHGVEDINLSASPGAVVYNDKIYIGYQGPNHDASIWASIFDGESFLSHEQMAEEVIVDSPTPLVFDGQLIFYYQSLQEEHYLAVTLYLPEMGFPGNVTKNVYLTGHLTYVNMPNKDHYFFYQRGDEKGYLWKLSEQDRRNCPENGIVGFCFKKDNFLNKRFGTFTIPSTHNSFIAAPNFYNGNNSHDEEVPFQLAQGIRFIELDINYDTFLENSPHEKGVAILHATFNGNDYGQLDVNEGLGQLNTWLEDNPEEILILKIDSPTEVSYEDLKYFFQKSELYDKFYTGPNRNYTTLTPQDILDADKQVLLFGGNAGDMDSGIYELMNNSTSWGVRSFDSFNPTASLQDKVAHPFYVLGMIGNDEPHGFGSPSKSLIINEYDWAKSFFLEGWRTSALRPMSFVFDYSTYGDLFEVVREMNTQYNSVMGVAQSKDGDPIEDVLYKVTYSSDGMNEEAIMSSAFNFPARKGETVTITPVKDGLEFDPPSYTYVNAAGDDTEVTFVVNPLDVNQIRETASYRLQMKPSYVISHATLSLSGGSAGEAQVVLSNMSGVCKVLADKVEISQDGKYEMNVEMSAYPSGVYMINIVQHKKVYQLKFVKM